MATRTFTDDSANLLPGAATFLMNTLGQELSRCFTSYQSVFHMSSSSVFPHPLLSQPDESFVLLEPSSKSIRLPIAGPFLGFSFLLFFADVLLGLDGFELQSLAAPQSSSVGDTSLGDLLWLLQSSHDPVSSWNSVGSVGDF